MAIERDAGGRSAGMGSGSGTVDTGCWGAAGCAHTTNFDVKTQWATLPVHRRKMLRRVTLPRVQATVADNGSGLTGTDVHQVPFAAVELARPSRSTVLYAVSWREPIFGVNAPIWLVEVGARGAIDRTPAPAGGNGAFLHDGFGVSTLSVGADGYPVVMIGSKVGVVDCLRKAGERYAEIACPVGCEDVMNRQ